MINRYLHRIYLSRNRNGKAMITHKINGRRASRLLFDNENRAVDCAWSMSIRNHAKFINLIDRVVQYY